MLYLILDIIKLVVNLELLVVLTLLIIEILRNRIYETGD